MNHIKDEYCRYCGSVIHLRGGRPHCSSDNLAHTKAIFDDILELEFKFPDEFNHRLEHLQENECSFDLFMDYWSRKKKDKSVHIKCIHEETYFRDITPDTGELPMPKPYIPFPDLVEVYIAEIMLGRELTGLEKDGSRYIPKISSKGLIYFAPLNWLTYPHSYMSKHRASDKILDLEPLPKVFDVETIRDMYKGRRGDLIDE